MAASLKLAHQREPYRDKTARGRCYRVQRLRDELAESATLAVFASPGIDDTAYSRFHLRLSERNRHVQCINGCLCAGFRTLGARQQTLSLGKMLFQARLLHLQPCLRHFGLGHLTGQSSPLSSHFRSGGVRIPGSRGCSSQGVGLAPTGASRIASAFEARAEKGSGLLSNAKCGAPWSSRVCKP